MESVADLLSLTSWREGRHAVVAVCGELDLATAPLLERTLAELVDDQSCFSIAIDLHELGFMGSTGLVVLLNALNHAHAGGVEMSLARPSYAVIRTLQIAGLDSTFTIRRDGDVAPDDRTPAT